MAKIDISVVDEGDEVRVTLDFQPAPDKPLTPAQVVASDIVQRLYTRFEAKQRRDDDSGQ